MSKTATHEHNHTHSQNRFSVLPTSLRMGIEQDATACGVTIAILDSGFYPHPDLTQPISRILAYHDITEPGATLNAEEPPKEWDWHGTMTSVVAAGNGLLSGGVYRALANEAQLVLIKVSDEGRITERNIELGLRWVLENRERYGIRVVSISLGGDRNIFQETNPVDQAAEDLVRAGVVVVVAAGNSGCTDDYQTVPPASSPSVITVGGYSDDNRLDGALNLYCSSFGLTANGVIKPEIIAPAMWIAAPILPGTAAYDRAEALSQLEAVPDYLLDRIARSVGEPNRGGIDLWERAGLGDRLRSESTSTIRSEVESMLLEGKIVATHYQHSDGTSFAAPIVASVVARMIEANPRLGPAAIKYILISTADRIRGLPAIRQGFGVLNARRALQHAKHEKYEHDTVFFCPPRVNAGKLEFAYHDDLAERVTLAGDFNAWDSDSISFAKDEDGVWRTRIEVLSPGRYRYKFIVNRERWIEDPANTSKEPDEYGGFNSILHIA